MDRLLETQKLAISQLKVLSKQYDDCHESPKLINSLNSELATWWFHFETTNTELQAFAADNPEQPYFVNDLFNTTHKVYNKLRERVQQRMQKASGSNIPEKPIPLVDFSTKFESSSEDEEEQDQSSSPKISDSLIIPDDVIENSGIRGLKLLLTDLQDIFDAVQAVSNPTPGSVLARIEILKQTWNDFRLAYNSERAKDNEQINFINFKQAQESYTLVYGKLNDFKTSSAKNENIQLPKLKIPEFSGKMAEWPGFITLFDKIVNENTAISDGLKIQYLKTSLSGDALKIIAHVAPNAANYKTCYSLLRNRFDNKRALVSRIIDKIFLLPKHRSESSEELKNLHDTVNECILSIKNAGIPTKNWDVLLVHIMLHKLSSETIKNYECQLQNVREPQKFSEFMTYIESRFLALQAVEAKNPAPSTSGVKFQKSEKNSPSIPNSQREKTCLYCKNKHAIVVCDQFKKLTIDERVNWSKNNKLCNNCLSNSHAKAECKSKFVCKICSKKHHSLLHFAKTVSAVVKLADDTANTVSANVVNLNAGVLLATALVYSRAKKDNSEVLLRALLDQGSQSNFITEHACQSLGLKKLKTAIKITGIDDASKQAKFKVHISIFPRFKSDFALHFEAIVLDKLPNISCAHTDTIEYEHLANLTFADPSLFENSPVNLLLGASEYAKLLKVGLIKGKPNEPIAQNTEFGWVISGQTANATLREINESTTAISTVDIEDALTKFFETDHIQDDRALNEEEAFCETHFVSNIKRVNNRYVVSLPFKNNLTEPVLGDSRKIAIATLLQLEKRFQKNPSLKAEYVKFIEEYVSLGHMELAKRDQSTASYFLPHHAVFKESTTTKLRVVFNASQKTSNGLSLNDQLAIGKTCQRDILAILIDWRFSRFAATSDIEKMYRQILVNPDQRNLQKILWRKSPGEAMKEYSLNTITYGTASAPYLAIRTLFQMADDVETDMPHIAKIIKNNFYVDDCLMGAHSFQQLFSQYKQLTSVLKSSGFNLRKWATNCPEFKNQIPCADLEKCDSDNRIKTLGLVWNTTSDELEINVGIFIDINKPNNTKRQLLSQIASLHDPMGWLAPCIIKAKILMQEIWILKKDWDDELPDDIVNTWNQMKSELNSIETLRIPRWIGATATSFNDLIGFCDASSRAYAAAVYIRTIDGNDVSIKLIVAKYKVAPIKTLTIPRLELLAAHLLSQLMKKVSTSTDTKFQSFHAFTDSKIVLDWIRGNPHRWKTFVATRVTKINNNISQNSWHHVPTHLNPADCASRGIFPNELKNNAMWWNAPDFLRTPEIQFPESSDDAEEREKSVQTESKPSITLTTTVEPSILPSASSYFKLKKVMAYCLRFINNCKNQVKARGPLIASDLGNAEVKIVQAVQFKYFSDDIQQLTSGKEINKQSRIRDLQPFLDQAGILRVGGRLSNANIDYNAKHQMLLPSKDEVTNLIIRAAHLKTLHGGPRLTEAVLKQKYWITDAQRSIKTVIRQCVSCTRIRGKTMQQMMANLPAARVNAVEKPFLNCAIDYAGPIRIKSSSIRNAKILKAYIAIFVCMAVKAIHIEPVSCLTSNGFIAALRRFIARRGEVKHIYCDNGTNFVGAARELGQIAVENAENFDQEVSNELIKQNISFHFSPAGSPHFNGLAEAAVKTIKLHLKKAIGDVALTFEELATVLYQIESAVNSRPLSAISADPNDVAALTPAHFLTLGATSTVPQQDVLETNINWVTRWQLVQRIAQQFWRRWREEYLHQLQTRTKWNSSRPEANINDLVLVKDENLPTTKWPLARIVEKHPGSDGKTRVVTVKTGSSTLKRSITKIAPLPNVSPPEAIKSKTKPKPLILPIITAMLAVVAVSLSTPVSATMPFTTQIFSKPPIIHFEKIADCYLTHTEWKLISYLDLNHYEAELNAINNSTLFMKDQCKNKLNMFSECLSLVNNIENTIVRILGTSANPIKIKRAALDIVGNIAADLFGVLDSKFAKEYASDIGKITKNEEHLLELLKNQTSVIESQTNVIKKHEQASGHVIKLINSLTSKINNNTDRDETYQHFVLLVLYVHDLVVKFEHFHNAINDPNIKDLAHIISKQQLEEQSILIQKHVDKSLMFPDTDVLKAVKIDRHITRKNVVFVLHIPLLTNIKYQVLQTYVIPIVNGNEFLLAKDVEPYVITSIDRTAYQTINEQEKQACLNARDNLIICSIAQMKNNRHDGCEWNILNLRGPKNCEFSSVTAGFMWIQIANSNNWIFATSKIEEVDTVCNERTDHLELNGVGAIALNPECTLNTEFKTIFANKEISSENKIVIPNTHFRSPNFTPIELKDLKISSAQNELNEIDEKIKEMKKQQHIQSVSHIHHYSASTIISVCITVAIVFKLYRKFFAKKQVWGGVATPTVAQKAITSEIAQVEIQMPEVVQRAIPMPIIAHRAISMPSIGGENVQDNA